MKKRGIVIVLALSVFAMHLGFGSVGPNNTLDEQAEAALVASIEYIEEDIEDDFELGFNVHQYLPLDFDPYEGMIYPLEEIDFIEHEEDLER